MDPSVGSNNSGSSIDPSTTAECPVCHELVLVRTINSHVDECLKEKNSSSSRKRQSPSVPLSNTTRKARIRRVGVPLERDARDRYLPMPNVFSILILSLNDF